MAHEIVSAYEFAGNQRQYQTGNIYVSTYHDDIPVVAADSFKSDKIVLFSFNEDGVPVPVKLVGHDYLLKVEPSQKMQEEPVRWMIDVSAKDWHLVRQYRVEVPAFGEKTESSWYTHTVYASVTEDWERIAPYSSFYRVEGENSGVNWGAHGTTQWLNTINFAVSLMSAANLSVKLCNYLSTQLPAWNALLAQEKAVKAANKKLFDEAVRSAQVIARKFAVRHVSGISEGETFVAILKHYLLFGTYATRDDLIKHQSTFSKNYLNRLVHLGFVTVTGEGKNWSVVPSAKFLEENDLHSLNIRLGRFGDPIIG